jgi:hypothetical protein
MATIENAELVRAGTHHGVTGAATFDTADLDRLWSGSIAWRRGRRSPHRRSPGG